MEPEVLQDLSAHQAAAVHQTFSGAVLLVVDVQEQGLTEGERERSLKQDHACERAHQSKKNGHRRNALPGSDAKCAGIGEVRHGYGKGRDADRARDAGVY